MDKFNRNPNQGDERGGGLRFNSGKTRMELIPPRAAVDQAKVWTMGAKKYGEFNWQRGMPWTTVLGSLKRHIAAIERGEDYDAESGLLHISHVQCNAAMLNEFYYIYPQGDDRRIINPFRRVVLDVDGIIADCDGGLKRLATDRGIEYTKEIQQFWSWEPVLEDLFLEVMNDPGFWMSLDPLVEPDKLTFEPIAYVTHRPVDASVTAEWLEKYGFPNKPVYSVPGSKVETLQKLQPDLFIDDKWENFLEATNAGIYTKLMSRTYNEKYHALIPKHRIIHSLDEINNGTQL